MSELIHQCMIKIMRDADGIVKEQTSRGGFKYRGIDDAYNTLHDILAKHGVYTVPRVVGFLREDRLSKVGNPLQYTILHVEYDFVAEDGSKVTIGPVVGEAMDSGDKSAAKSMAISHKYALFQVFMIPTNLSVDPDNEVHELIPAPPVLATKEQHGIIKDYRAMGGTTDKQNEWLDENNGKLTEQQASNIINKLESK